MNGLGTVLISANPKSGNRSRRALVEDLQAAIESLGYSCELSSSLPQVMERARVLYAAGELRSVVAAGGDGTASTVASLIPESVPLSLFPMGSENLLATHFGITADPDRCAQTIHALRTECLDAMHVNDRLTLLMASVGFDAEVVRRVHQSRKSHITRLAYWSGIVSTIFFYRWPTLKIAILDERSQVMETMTGSWVFVFNLPRYAAGLSIVDDASAKDGLLDIGIFAPGGLLSGLWYYWCVVRGRHHGIKQWRCLRANGIRIENDGAAASCQADGDWAGEAPVSIQIASRKLLLVVP